MDSAAFLLEGRNIRKSFVQGGITIEVLKGIDIAIRQGEMTGIVGASGSGKTTLLQILGTLAAPNEGAVLFRGRDLVRAGEAELSRHRNENIGFIFQFHHLLPEFTALENVMMPGLINGMERNQLREKASELLDRVNLSHRVQHRSGELSGGEQQRVALARALVMEPALLLADEPTGNLHSDQAREIMRLFKEVNKRGTTIIQVTHSEENASYGDRIIRLADGWISGEEQVKPAEAAVS
ncbi:MAG: ABC transporter ATP-binding protein [Desulfobulbaceae bacterium]